MIKTTITTADNSICIVSLNRKDENIDDREVSFHIDGEWVHPEVAHEVLELRVFSSVIEEACECYNDSSTQHSVAYLDKEVLKTIVLSVQKDFGPLVIEQTNI